jgi:hypothetical protein
MHIYDKVEIDTDLDYQLVDAGGGLLEVYQLGAKANSFPIGEVAMRNLKSQVDRLSEWRAQQLIQEYCDTAAQLRMRGSKRP